SASTELRTFERITTCVIWRNAETTPFRAFGFPHMPVSASSSAISGSSEGWQKSLSAAIRDPDVLIDRLGLPEALREPARQAARLFPLLVPESFLKRMRPGDPSDPLLRQVL